MKRILILLPFFIFLASCEKEALFEADQIQNVNNPVQTVLNSSMQGPNVVFDISQAECCNTGLQLGAREIQIDLDPATAANYSTINFFFYIQQGNNWYLWHMEPVTEIQSFVCLTVNEYRIIAVAGSCVITDVDWVLNDCAFSDITVSGPCPSSNVTCIDLDHCSSNNTNNNQQNNNPSL